MAAEQTPKPRGKLSHLLVAEAMAMEGWLPNWIGSVHTNSAQVSLAALLSTFGIGNLHFTEQRQRGPTF